MDVMMILLSENEKQKLKLIFPVTKLSYENIIYKKVITFDFLMAIPKGIKCFVWFINYNNKDCCFLFYLDIIQNTFQIKSAYILKNMMRDNISELYGKKNGTIFYGTIFYVNERPFFTVESFYYFKEKDVQQIDTKEYLKLLYDLFTNFLPFGFFGAPIIKTNFNQLILICKELKYSVESIQYNFNEKNKKTILMTKYYSYNDVPIDISHQDGLFLQKKKSIDNNKTQIKNNQVFKVKASLQDDIYNLFIYDYGNKNTFYDVALVPNYKTSVLMNEIFRKIKENKNLDALEESDDEDEFQNNNEDKFVNLNKSALIVCSFNYKFKKWVPICIANKNDKIANKNDLYFFTNTKKTAR
jgi:hypothetical protein